MTDKVVLNRNGVANGVDEGLAIATANKRADKMRATDGLRRLKGK